ncbi:MAG: hypothetical protein ACREPF_00870 [Rhodanobacteraceae bacterium]
MAGRRSLPQDQSRGGLRPGRATVRNIDLCAASDRQPRAADEGNGPGVRIECDGIDGLKAIAELAAHVALADRVLPPAEATGADAIEKNSGGWNSFLNWLNFLQRNGRDALTRKERPLDHSCRRDQPFQPRQRSGT